MEAPHPSTWHEYDSKRGPLSRGTEPLAPRLIGHVSIIQGNVLRLWRVYADSHDGSFWARLHDSDGSQSRTTAAGT